MSEYRHFQIHPLSPALGAEISGIDLDRPLGDEATAEIRRAWLAHHVLFFRGQSLDIDAYKAFARRFEDMTEEESRPLLHFLLEHLARPELTCRFRWTPGSLAFWDNRCVQHYPISDYRGHRREMHRLTLAGDRPY